MFLKVYNFWQVLKSNLWFVPAALSLLFFIVVLASYYLEKTYFAEIGQSILIFDIKTADAKSMVVILLSAMITMATLAVSVTMISLSMAASQLGPRLIKTFMADRTTKYYIGFFFGVVIACFALAIILHNAHQSEVIFKITTTLVFSLCFVNLFILLGYFHHAAKSCIADNVILSVANDLTKAISRKSEPTTSSTTPDDAFQESWIDDFKNGSSEMFFEKCGYIQNIDYDRLITICEDENIKLDMSVKAGDYVMKGQGQVFISPKMRMNEDNISAIRDCFITGELRTSTQDLEYSIRHLVEIAIRALSSGINDSFTAVNVLDHMSGALAELLKEPLEKEWLQNEDGKILLRAKQNNEEDIIFSAYEQIRQSAQNTPYVLTHMRKNLEVLKMMCAQCEQKEILNNYIELLTDDLNETSVKEFES